VSKKYKAGQVPAFFLLPLLLFKTVVACYTELLCEGRSRRQQQALIRLWYWSEQLQVPGNIAASQKRPPIVSTHENHNVFTYSPLIAQRLTFATCN
jgi:hypothetical protein